MAQFIAETEKINDLEFVKLVDRKNAIQAQIIPALGNNLVSLTVGIGSKISELIWIPSEIKKLKDGHHQFYGNPILFPFPGRIPSGQFDFQNQKFQVPINFEDGTAIHGFVYNKKWELSQISDPSDRDISLKSTFRSTPAIEKFFPFPFRVEMTYTLRPFELELSFTAENIGTKAFPFGYGIHPYFLLSGERSDWVLYFPAEEHFELIDLLPTGNTHMVPEMFDFRKEKSLKDIYMDDLFGNLKKDTDGYTICWIRNVKTNFKLSVISDPNFDFYVLFAPKWGPFICIEPYTCIPNAFNLANKGISTGLRILAPKEIFKTRILFKIEV